MSRPQTECVWVTTQNLRLFYLPGCRVELASLNGSKIDFSGEPIFELASWFFLIILKFIFTPIFEIKIHEKKFFVFI